MNIRQDLAEDMFKLCSNDDMGPIGLDDHPGKGFRQLGRSAASEKSDVTRAEGGGAVSTLAQLNQFHLQVTSILVSGSVDFR